MYDAALANKYTGRRVNVYLINGDTHKGTIEAAGPGGIMLRIETGDFPMWEGSVIAKVSLQRPPPVLIKDVSHVSDSSVRQHLADRHGMWLETVNELTGDEAMDIHASISHERLSHRHVTKPVKPKQSDEIPGQMRLDDNDN